MTTAPRDQLEGCPFCGGPARALVTTPAPEYGLIIRQVDYGEDGLEVEVQASCHECGAGCYPLERTLYTAEDYDEAIAHAAQGWNDRRRAAQADALVRADARRYRRLLHEGLRFMAHGKLHRTKAETDAAIDAMPDPSPATASRM